MDLQKIIPLTRVRFPQVAPQRLQIPVHRRLVVAVVRPPQPLQVPERAQNAPPSIAGGPPFASFPSRSQIAPFAAAASFPSGPQVVDFAPFARRLQPIARRSQVAAKRHAF